MNSWLGRCLSNFKKCSIHPGFWVLSLISVSYFSFVHIPCCHLVTFFICSYSLMSLIRTFFLHRFLPLLIYFANFSQINSPHLMFPFQKNETNESGYYSFDFSWMNLNIIVTNLRSHVTIYLKIWDLLTTPQWLSFMLFSAINKYLWEFLFAN